MSEFEKWAKLFSAQNLYAFNHNAKALLWLKVKAVSRSRQLLQFCHDNDIVLTAKKIAQQSEELYERLLAEHDAMQRLDTFLNERSNEWYETMAIDENRLREDLYKVKHYAWGGDQSNSLDRHLVSRYVKTVCLFDELQGRQPEIAENAWNYVLVSWYNNWTSYLTEALFKRHEKVVPAVGEIKSVDFFLNDIPFDLKITYFPKELMEKKMKEKLGKSELSWLRQMAREVGVSADCHEKEAQQVYTLTEKLTEKGQHDILNVLNNKRKEVVCQALTDPTELMTWLYSRQGEMRFGAENRLFLILADTTDMTESWKMKRAFSLIEPTVNDYLNHFDSQSLKEITFSFKGNAYKALADTIFVVKQ